MLIDTRLKLLVIKVCLGTKNKTRLNNTVYHVETQKINLNP